MRKNIESFFHPHSVAIVGASQSPDKVGAIALANVLHSGYRGHVYPINPKGGVIQGLPVYENLTAIGKSVDLVVIATPISTILPLIDEMGSLGIKNVVIFTAGFGELGKEGHLLEKEVLKRVQNYDMNLLGPNCLGFVTTTTPINTTFGQAIKEKGNLFLLSQSGAIASSIFDWCGSVGMGLSSAVTIGNKIDLNENDILSYWLTSHKEVISYRVGMAHVMPIGMYLESISNGNEFVRLCRKLVVSHPLFILKPGKSSEAKKAMQSHTGAIAGEDAVLEAALSHAGVIRCEGMEDFFDLTKAFSWEDAPKGPRVAVVSNAGGPAVISADLIASYGLTMSKLSKETQDKLDDVLPRSASLKNPIDVLGDALADRYEAALHAVLAEDQVDGLIVILTPQVMTQIEETAQVIGKLSKHYRKPILCAFIGGSRVAAGERLLNGFKIPVFRFPERAIYAFSKMWQWMEVKTAMAKESELKAPPISEKEIDVGSYGHVLSSLKEVGVIAPPTVRVSTLDEAVHFFKKQKGKVVLKLYAPKLLHKKEMDAVIVNIETQSQLSEAFSRIRKSQDTVLKTLGVSSTVYIQRMEKIEIEMLVGIKTDSQFGKVLLFGAGGALSELISDRNMVLLPTSPRIIRETLEKAKVFKLLAGFRGENPYDVSAVVHAIYAFTLWVQKHPSIVEAEINPLIINRKGIFAVDVKTQIQER